MPFPHVFVAVLQINVGHVDAVTGRYAGTYKTFALCGYVRQKGEADQALNTLIARCDALDAHAE